MSTHPMQLLGSILGVCNDGKNLIPRQASSISHVASARRANAYRVIRDDEDPSKGMSATDPTANYAPEGHVLHGSKPNVQTQYISASSTYEAAVKNSQAYGTGQERIVQIDLAQVNDSLDLNGSCSLLKGTTMRNWAKASSEVLIVGHVPPSAIKIVRP